MLKYRLVHMNTQTQLVFGTWNVSSYKHYPAVLSGPHATWSNIRYLHTILAYKPIPDNNFDTVHPTPIPPTFFQKHYSNRRQAKPHQPRAGFDWSHQFSLHPSLTWVTLPHARYCMKAHHYIAPTSSFGIAPVQSESSAFSWISP